MSIIREPENNNSNDENESEYESDYNDNDSDNRSDNGSDNSSNNESGTTVSIGLIPAYFRPLRFWHIYKEEQNELIISCIDSDAIFLIEKIHKWPERLTCNQLTCIQNEDGQIYSVKALTTYSLPIQQMEQDFIPFDEDEYEEYNIPKYVWLFIYGYYTHRFNMSNFKIKYAYVEYGNILGVYGYNLDDNDEKVYFRIMFPNNKEECGESSFQMMVFGNRMMYIDITISSDDNIFGDSNCNCSNDIFLRDASDIKIAIVNACFLMDFT
jgi:hypothetical protein